MQTMQHISRLDNIIGGAKRVTILTHTHPDGDAIGSSTGACHWLRSLGKDATIVIPDELPRTLEFAATAGGVIDATAEPAKARERILSSDTLLCLDFNRPDRIGTVEPMFAASPACKVLIDHHLNPAEDLFDLVISTTETSSASELLYNTLLALPSIAGDPFNLPLETAEALMTGMTTDTNNFANSVFPSTLKMASELLERGVDRDAILSKLYNSYRENRVRAMAFLLSEKLVITPWGVAYIIFDSATKERFQILPGETEGLVNIPLSIDRVRLSLLLTEDDGHFRVSIRSKKGTSANRLATESFNGGGHECASGGKLYFPKDIESPEMAAEYIERVTARFVQNGTAVKQ